MRLFFKFMGLLLLMSSCNKNDGSNASENSNSLIKYFGFTIIDTYWDDPTDSEIKTNYANEIHSFSNIADILIVNSNDDVVQRAQTFAELDLKAILHLNELFFELVDNNSPSESNYNLRSDYQERWNEFKFINQSILNTDYTAAFYIGEEPTWNGITFAELNSVSALLQIEFPNIPTMVIEAYPSIENLQIPESVDWVGFDHYFVKNPNTNAEFQQEWNTLKSKLSNPNQRIIIILDSHYIDWAHGDFGNIELVEMDEVASNYFELAKSEERVIGILGYFWPNGFDTPESVGARGMPQNVKMEYERIGREITKK